MVAKGHRGKRMSRLAKPPANAGCGLDILFPRCRTLTIGSTVLAGVGTGIERVRTGRGASCFDRLSMRKRVEADKDPHVEPVET
jgi:hypothetical protein